MLSICVPTWNRSKFLKWSLERLSYDFPDADIVVSDNASTDDTRTVGLNYRYIRQDSNIGAFPNMFAALSAAKGDYAVYCADDDYLLPGPMAAAIAFMDEHPEVQAYCAPCELWNEVAKTPFWNAYKLKEPLTFSKADGIDLFNFLICSHVWPEHWIYRLPLAIKPRTEAYWAFVDIPDLLARGSIHFSPVPFYRNLIVSAVGDRVQLGNEQCLTHFEQYRAGLEVLAFGLFGDGLPYAARHRIQEMIQWFLCARMDIAAQLHERHGREAEAQMLRKRLAIASPARDSAQAA
jgi:glycosyltransferase involved in cell wall biosynthesis